MNNSPNELAAVAAVPPYRQGGPAFPHNDRDELGNVIGSYRGMTLRDAFAIGALTSLVAAMPTTEISPSGVQSRCEVLADHAYRIAEAMLARRGCHA
jgi:hypothetical protein